MNVNDVLELTLYQRYLGTVEVRNVLHYVVSSVTTGDEGSLATAFNLDVLPLLLDVQHTGLSHYKQVVANITDGIGLSEIDLIPDQPGVLAGELEPPFVCYAFRKNRLTRQTRSGQVRFAGVPEGAVNNGLAGVLVRDDLDELAEALGSTISDGLGNTFSPAIIRKTATGGVAIINGIVNVEYVSISSQVTRKYGRGI